MREGLMHVGETFDCLGEALDGLLRVPMRDSVAYTMSNMSFQDDLADPMERGFSGVDLGKNVLTGDIFFDHSVNGLDLPDDFAQAAVQVFYIHALSHFLPPIPIGVYAYYRGKQSLCQGGREKVKKEMIVTYIK